jgi:hypothetical protein
MHVPPDLFDRDASFHHRGARAVFAMRRSCRPEKVRPFGAAGPDLVNNPRMSSNPYAPPLAKVEDTPDPEAGRPQFFAVAPWKMVVMCLATLGFYELYWSYEHWRIVRARDGSKILPVPRAIFSIFYCYALFSRVARDGTARNLSGAPAAGALAAGWIVSSLAWRLPGGLALLGLLSWFTMIPIQAYANRINAQAAPTAPRNDRLTWANWIIVAFALVFWGLVLLAVMFPTVDRRAVAGPAEFLTRC